MSTRTQLYSITSMEPILQVVGSGDSELLGSIVGDSTGEDAEWAKSMLSSSPPDDEPGAWNYAVRDLAEHLGLEMKFLKLDDWKHYGVWEEYIPRVEAALGEECTKMLSMLQHGRPLKGTKVKHDGSCFAWLSADETSELLKQLKGVQESNLSDDEDIGIFHKQLVDSLKIASKAGHAIFLAAH